MTRKVQAPLRPLSLPDLELRHPQTTMGTALPAHGFGDLDDVRRMATCVTSELSACRLRRMRESSVSVPERSAEALLGVVMLVRTLRAALDLLEAETIEEARDLGVPWRDLAAPLGVSGRAAAERKARRMRSQRAERPGHPGERG